MSYETTHKNLNYLTNHKKKSPPRMAGKKQSIVINYTNIHKKTFPQKNFSEIP